MLVWDTLTAVEARNGHSGPSDSALSRYLCQRQIRPDYLYGISLRREIHTTRFTGRHGYSRRSSIDAEGASLVHLDTTTSDSVSRR